MHSEAKKVALITGASRGIGRAVAVALAKSGCYTFLNYRIRQADAEATLAEIQRGGGAGELCPFDVADAAAREKAIAARREVGVLGKVASSNSTVATRLAAARCVR